MKQLQFGAILDAASARNDGLAAFYASAAHHVLSRPLARFAAAVGEQRHDLARELEDLLPLMRPDLALLAVELDEALFAGPESLTAPEMGARELAELIKGEEDRDRELFSLLAAKAAEKDRNLAETLAHVADAARKRASTAADHLDLLGMGGG